MYRVGIIGCGFIGVEAPDSHLEAYRDCADTSLYPMCDLKMKISKYTPGVYTDYMEMVTSEKLDIVSICTPVETHCQIVCDIAPYVKAIYCEKPIAPTLAEADKMIRTCHENNVILQINHQRRFIPVKVRFSRGILNTGTHMFDRLRQLFGEFEGSSGNLFFFGNQQVEIEYIDTAEPIFEIDCVRSSERMILKGVEHLVECLKRGNQSISSGEEARKTLDVVLVFEGLYEKNK